MCPSDCIEDIDHLFFTCDVARSIWCDAATYLACDINRNSLVGCVTVIKDAFVKQKVLGKVRTTIVYYTLWTIRGTGILKN